jgi:hypothetical protein
MAPWSRRILVVSIFQMKIAFWKTRFLFFTLLFWLFSNFLAAGPVILRPDITKLNPTDHKIGAEFEAFVQGEVEAVLSWIETYPDRELYFFGRDAERLGEVAKLIAIKLGDKKLLNRIHILYVSRAAIDRAGWDPQQQKIYSKNSWS